MQTIEDRLKALMAAGWNIDIECKSSEREYALTYEGHASRQGGWRQVHGTGETLTELLDELEDGAAMISEEEA